MEFKYIIIIFTYMLKAAKLEEVKLTREISLHQYDCNIAECSGKNYSIFHFKGQIKETLDVVHYVVSAINLPSVIVAHTTVATDVKVNWTAIAANKVGGIAFYPPANTSGALTLTKLIEYEDAKDTFDLKNVIRDVLKGFDWKVASVVKEKNQVSFSARSKSVTGVVNFEVMVFADNGYDSRLPAEPYSCNSSRFTVALDGLAVNTTKSRYAVEITYLVDGAVHQKSPLLVTDQSIDDEHTPGIFKLSSLTISSSEYGTFASWKPVAYSKPDRSRSTQVLAYSFPSKDGVLYRSASHPWSVADSYMKQPQGYGINYTFGLADQYYNDSRYLGWTAIVGYGTPPADNISTLVIVIISVGLGLPAAIILFGGTGLCCRRYFKRRTMQYQQIN